jgi:SAM-dependent methyltransferase
MIEAPSSKRSTYDPQFFPKIAAVEDQHFWFVARNRIIAAAVRNVVADLPPKYRLLEVGCGTGVVLRHLAKVCEGGEILGMDLFPEAVAFAGQRASCPVIVGDILEPSALGQFDVVTIFDVLEHLPNDARIVAGLNQILKPGGRLVLTVPAHMSLWSYFDVAARHCRRYSVAELDRLLRENGFEVKYLTQFMMILFPMIWLLRRLRGGQAEVGHDKAAEKAARELKVVPLINSFLKMILGAEAWAIKYRIRLPLGTSLLAVASKVRAVS